MTPQDGEQEAVRSAGLLNSQDGHIVAPPAEGELRRQTEWLRVTLASIGDGVISTDSAGMVTFLNAVAQSLTGWSASEAHGRLLTDIFHIVNEYTRQPTENPVVRALQHGRIVGLANHTVLIAKDGTERSIDDSAAPIRDDSGTMIGAVLIFRDVTERQRAERAVRESEALHRFLAELALQTQSLVEPDQILRLTARALAQHLNVDRCAYAEVEAESIFVINGDYARDVPTIVGRWPVSAFGAECNRLMLANEPYVVHDVNTDPRISPEDRPAYRATTIEAVICLPLHKGQKFTAAMAVHQKQPRRWTDAEVALVRTVVAHCWEALERSRVTRTLQESEARYRAMVEATPECVKIVSPDGRLLQINSAGLKMLEADRSVLGATVYDVVAPEYRDAFRMFNEQICRGEQGALQFDVIGLMGTRRRLESNAVPLPASDGSFTHLSVTRDITRRAEAERALAEQRARLDFAARIAGIGFWYCDLPFDSLTWDELVKDHFWLPPDADVTIDTFFERIHADDRDFVQQAIESSIQEAMPFDVRYRTVDPESTAVKWIRALGGPSYGPTGEATRFDGVTVDVTAQKLDEERLARLLERERKQGRLLQKVADAALTIHSSGSLDSVLRVVAEEARNVIGAHQAVTSLTVGDDWSQSINTVSLSDKYAQWADYDRLPSGKGIYSVVCKTNRPMRLTQEQLENHPAWQGLSGEGGRHPPLRGWLAVPFVSRSGKNLGLVQVSDKYDGEFTDSDEAILIQFGHIASVAIENARLYSELRDQDRRKDEFLAILAHELRNPLAPLRNGVEVMRLAGTTGQEVGSVRAMMDRQLSHMVRLIDDLLDVSRIGRNKMELRLARISLIDVVNSAVETVRAAIDEAGLTLTVLLPDEPVYLTADLTRLAQVFGNLLSNSAKYTQRGGQVWLTAHIAGSEVVITVRDTGIGIPETSLTAIFDIFSQVDRSIERTTGGLGIGLSLVKGLVTMHGGTVEATSPGPGQGSTFTVRLPLAEDGAIIARPRSPQEPFVANTPTCRILIVDDNRDAAISMEMMLKLLGNEVWLAHDGLEAVELAEQVRPNIILMDVGMPKLNGYDATRRIRQHSWARQMAIIALTGWGQDVDRMHSREAGCDAHLVKPVSLPQLKQLLTEYAVTE